MNTEKSGCLFVIFHMLGLLPKKETNFAFKAAVIDAEVAEPVLEFEPELVELPYRIRDDFLSPAERSFYLALRAALADRALIFPKVSLGDILFTTDKQNFRKHTNRINQKHVDYLICSRDSVRPLVAIELDDSSHQRESARERDQFKDAAFAAAGLPLVRIKTKRSYDAREIASILLPYIDVAPGAIPYASVATSAQPTCPKCGVSMVQRTASRGQQAGKPFFGCPNFPRCREIAKAN